MGAVEMIVWPLLRRSFILVVIGGLAVLLWLQMSHPERSSERVLVRTAIPELDLRNATVAASQSQSSSARDLFIGVAPPPPAPPPQVLPQAIPPLSLVGTGIGPPSFAILRSTATGVREKVTTGSKFVDWVVVEIRKNDILIEQNTVRWIVRFPPLQPLNCSESGC